MHISYYLYIIFLVRVMVESHTTSCYATATSSFSFAETMMHKIKFSEKSGNRIDFSEI